MREEGIVLEDNSDRSALGRSERRAPIVDHPAVDADRSSIDGVQPSNRPHECGLACSIRPEDRHHGARLDVGGDGQGEVTSGDRAVEVKAHGRAAPLM